MKKTNKIRKDLESLYIIHNASRWMEIMSDKEVNHPAYKNYLRLKKRLMIVSKYIDFKKTDKVADFGCGSGLWGDLIHKKVKSYVGIDFSKPYIQLAKKRQKVRKLTNVTFYCMNIIKFAQYHQRKFDQAFAFDFSEHLSDMDFKLIFQAIRKTMKSGSHLYIHTPNSDYILEILKKYGILEQPQEHLGVRNSQEYYRLLRQIKFQSIEIYYLPHYHELLSIFHFLSFLPLVGKYFKARLLIKCMV